MENKQEHNKVVNKNEGTRTVAELESKIYSLQK